MTSISITDNITFESIVDVLNKCFGCNYAAWMKGYYPLNPENTMGVWFPKMAVYKNERYYPQNKNPGWINVVSDDGRTIRMYTEDNHLMNDNFWNVIHFTFGKEKGEGYKYLGTYVKRKTARFPYEALFERVATSLELIDWSANLPEEDEDVSALGNVQLLRLALQHGTENPETTVTESKTYKRDRAVSQYAKRRAAGICELCGNEAPFRNREGEPYLETHHIVPLADHGADTIENTVALCPNCHRKMHQLGILEDIEKLKDIPKYQI